MPWDWQGVSKNPNVDWQIVQTHLNYNWDWYYISCLEKVTWEIVQSNLHLPWDGMSYNPNITWEIVQANLHLPWCWHAMSYKPDVTWEIIQANLRLDWKWSFVSVNPNITYDIIKSNPQFNWDWDQIVKDRFTLQHQVIEDQCRREWSAATVIKRNFIRTFWDPVYFVGMKRLMRSLETDEYSVW